MKATDVKVLQEKCTRGGSLPCREACPFGIDTRTIVSKIAEGNIEKAKTVFLKSLTFPRIVSKLCPGPCEESCPQNVSVRALERFCLSLPFEDEPRFKLPVRQKKVAIIGGGLRAISCSWRLSDRGWGVDLYVKEAELGENIRDKVDESLVNADFEPLKKSRINFKLSEDLSSDDIAAMQNGTEYEVVYVAPSENTVYGIANGIKDADEIEKVLKIGGEMSFVPVTEEYESREFDNAFSCENELIDNASLCNGCECIACQTNCLVMQHYGRLPEKLFVDVAASLGAQKGISNRAAQKQINSCNLCGLCTCPSGVDFEYLFVESRRSFVEDGRISPAFHEFFMNDMAHAISEHSFYCSGNKADYVFFPGCQLGASNPDYVISTYELLKKEIGNVALILSCCGAPAYWAGDKKKEQEVTEQIENAWNILGNPKFVTACPSCEKQLGMHIDSIEMISVYELLKDYSVNGSNANGKRVAVFDPCSSSGKSNEKRAVRCLLEKSGFELAPSPKESCCGNGGHMRAVAPELFDEIAKDSAFSSDEDYVTYCINCRDIFASRGKKAMHILDLYRDIDIESALNRPYPTWGERRANREKLLTYFTGEKHMEFSKKLIFTDELKRKMYEELISEYDVKKTINYCEETGSKIIDKNSDIIRGHMREHTITLWVEYRIIDGGYELINTYTHRMEPQEGKPDGK